MLNLTDAQIARLFTLTEEIAKVKQEIPVPPFTYVSLRQEVQEEIAKNLRDSLEKHILELIELATLLNGLRQEDYRRVLVTPRPNSSEREYSEGFVRHCLGLPYSPADWAETATPEHLAELQKQIAERIDKAADFGPLARPENS